MTDRTAAALLIADRLARVLSTLGYDTNHPMADDHMVDTPLRWGKALLELTDSSLESFEFTTFPNTNDNQSEMVHLGPIPFHTLCAHHILPFFGEAYVAYVPKDTVAGISKLARVVRFYSKGLWVQEELTTAIATRIENELDPIGTAVLMRAEHMCMTMRGIKSPGSKTTTSEMRGCFLDPAKQARAEFFAITNGQNS